MKYLLFFIFAVMMSFSVSASITCSPSFINYDIQEEQTPSSTSITCFLQGINQTNLTTKIDASNSIQLSYNLPIQFDSSNMARNFDINFNQKPKGNYKSFLVFTDGTIININYNVSAKPAPQCQINPSLVSYYQSVQQGTTLNLPKIIFSPTNCDGSLSLSASTVTMQGGIVTTSGQRPVYIGSIESNGINLVVDTNGLATQQTYTSTLTIQSFGKTFTIPFNIVVTAGVTPATNFSINNLPQCSLTNNILNLNSTYRLICNNMQPDITVQPSIDNLYLIGVGLESSVSTYTWSFQPIKFGNTRITANFFYRNAPVGQPFTQDVNIQSTGYVVPGTSLKVSYFPLLSQARENERVTIQLVDNSSGNLINDGEIQIDSTPISKNGSNYYFNFLSSHNYSLRARASGYNDLVQTIGLELRQMILNITPQDGDDLTTYNIKTDIANATLMIDSNIVTNPYIGSMTYGVHTIKATKDGYYQILRNVTINEAVKIAETPYTFESGSNFVIMLNKNSSFSVNFQKDINSNTENLTSGTGTKISFSPKNAGIYTVMADNRVLQTYSLEKTWFEKYWYYFGGGVALIVIILIIRNRNSNAGGSISGVSVGGLSGA